ncbi:hypothetical protein D9X30_5089 [Cupriavidus sp. U2]|nr:hypothetical protein D9X30_5089 [Cupriavidus sp. U2]
MIMWIGTEIDANGARHLLRGGTLGMTDHREGSAGSIMEILLNFVSHFVFHNRLAAGKMP